jgi:Ca2+-binding RTX toxin-like protein
MSGLGSDTLRGIDRALFFFGDGGNTLDASAFHHPVTARGGAGNDVLIGGSASDSLDGGAGNDILIGGDGDDTLQGNSGADQLNGDDGNDALFGNVIGLSTDGSPDILSGGNGNDTLSATDPTDVLDEGSGTGGILVQGTDGDDVIVIRRVVGPDGPEVVLDINGVETAIQYRNGETVQVDGGKGNDLIIMDPTAAVTWSAIFHGGDGNDALIGAGKGDYLDGGAGDDSLYGLGGDDTLLGGDGRDYLDGGAGSDVIDGGAGKDTVQAADGEVDYILVDNHDVLNGVDVDDVVIGRHHP